LQHARGAAFTVTVGHVAAEDDLGLTDEIQNMR
jgi:hypothetical protein